MNGSGQIIDRLATRTRDARLSVLSCANRFVKVFLVAVILFTGGPVCASHANAHLDHSKSQIAATAVSVADTSTHKGDAGSDPFSGMEHHFCYSPCLEACPNRSYVTAYLEGTRVRYSAYLAVLGATRDPAPLRKPPRLGASA